ncbi:MAG: hypothetical protein ABEH59_02865 [Halobacteriales archaeon]
MEGSHNIDDFIDEPKDAEHGEYDDPAENGCPVDGNCVYHARR